MTYQRALGFLNRDQFVTTHGRDYYGKIDRIRYFLDMHGNPDQAMKVILVGGTVGKTSTSYYIARLLEKCGYRAGLHVSPHLQSPRERIQVNGRFIAQADFATLVDQFKIVAKKINLSYAEFLLAIAIIRFNQQKIDFAVIEVGLGGLYDATNCLNPVVSVITNIGHDHSYKLGRSNLAKLREKFAIVRPGKSLVTGITQPALQGWINKRAKRDQVVVKYIPSSNDYQYNDLTLALATAGLLMSKNQSLNHRINLQIPGRLEWLSNRLLIDCAHNKPGLRALKKYLLTNQIDCEFVVAKPGSDEQDSTKFVGHVMNQLKHSQQTICATGSILAVGALRNLWHAIA